MAQLQEDAHYMGEDYMVDFEDDAEEQLLIMERRNSLDTDSDDDNDVVRIHFTSLLCFNVAFGAHYL